MNTYAVVAAFVVLAVALAAGAEEKAATQMVGSSYGGGSSAPSYGNSASAPSYGSGASAPSYGSGSSGSSYGGSSGGQAPVMMPAPPCPKNWIVSCAPSLSPAPCSPQAVSGSSGYGASSSGSSGYGSAGAYSESYPVYAYAAPVPPYGFY